MILGCLVEGKTLLTVCERLFKECLFGRVVCNFGIGSFEPGGMSGLVDVGWVGRTEG